MESCQLDVISLVKEIGNLSGKLDGMVGTIGDIKNGQNQLHETLDGVVSRLDKQNGSVQSHGRDIDLLKTWKEDHDKTCPGMELRTRQQINDEGKKGKRQLYYVVIGVILAFVSSFALQFMFQYLGWS